MRYETTIPLTYQGSPTCTDPACVFVIDMVSKTSVCIGHHCSYCDQPCAPVGHQCEVAQVFAQAATPDQ